MTRRPRRIAEPDDSDAEREPLPDADPDEVARGIVLRLLTGRARSRADLEAALVRRGVPEDSIRRVLDRYVEVGLVNDSAYAEMVVRTRQQSQGLARRAIAQQLRTHGVSDDDAGEALDSIQPEDEEARARELVERRIRSMRGVPREAQLRRLGGMLARKGYPAGIAARVVREIVDAAPVDH
jgi:regulatory protein